MIVAVIVIAALAMLVVVAPEVFTNHIPHELGFRGDNEERGDDQ